MQEWWQIVLEMISLWFRWGGDVWNSSCLYWLRDKTGISTSINTTMLMYATDVGELQNTNKGQ